MYTGYSLFFFTPHCKQPTRGVNIITKNRPETKINFDNCGHPRRLQGQINLDGITSPITITHHRNNVRRLACCFSRVFFLSKHPASRLRSLRKRAHPGPTKTISSRVPFIPPTSFPGSLKEREPGNEVVFPHPPSILSPILCSTELLTVNKKIKNN